MAQTMIPKNEVLERSLLGGLILNQSEYYSIQELFHEDLFYDEKNRIVARAIKSLKSENKNVDLLSVSEWCAKAGLSKQCSFLDISLLTNGCALSGFDQKVSRLNEYFIRRSFIVKNSELIQSASEETCDVFDLIDNQEKNLNFVTSKISVGKTSDAMDCHLELLKHLEAIEALVGGNLIGVDTGFKDLNTLTAGWQKSDLIIIAGRPGMGKTSFALNLAHNASKSVPVLFFSLEMSKLQLYARLCAQTTTIPLDYFLKVKMSSDQRNYFNRNSESIASSKMYVEDKGGMDLPYIKTKTRKLVRDNGIGLVVVDYLQLISKPKTNKSTNDEVAEISGALKGLAKELNIPIIALSQLTRSVESTTDKRPQLVHLRDSGSIEQDADIVQFVYRPEYYGITDDGNGGSTVGLAEIITAKHRNGATGSCLLGFEGKCTNFYDLKSNANSHPF